VSNSPAGIEDARWNDLERRALDWQTRGGRQTFVASDTFSDEEGPSAHSADGQWRYRRHRTVADDDDRNYERGVAMKRTLLMPCLIAVGFAIVVLLAAGVEAGTLLVAVAALACPLMMLLMMGGMFGMARRHGSEHASDASPQEDAAART
jgi:hypothetical protein